MGKANFLLKVIYALTPPSFYRLGYAEGDEDYAQFDWGPYGSDVADPLASAAGTQCHANLLNPGQLDGG
jgi:hypothetical protein